MEMWCNDLSAPSHKQGGGGGKGEVGGGGGGGGEVGGKGGGDLEQLPDKGEREWGEEGGKAGVGG